MESKSSGREAPGRTIIPPGLGGERAVSGGRKRPLRLDRIGAIFVQQKITWSFTPLTKYNTHQVKGGEKGGKEKQPIKEKFRMVSFVGRRMNVYNQQLQQSRTPHNHPDQQLTVTFTCDYLDFT